MGGTQGQELLPQLRHLKTKTTLLRRLVIQPEIQKRRLWDDSQEKRELFTPPFSVSMQYYCHLDGLKNTQK